MAADKAGASTRPQANGRWKMICGGWGAPTTNPVNAHSHAGERPTVHASVPTYFPRNVSVIVNIPQYELLMTSLIVLTHLKRMPTNAQSLLTINLSFMFKPTRATQVK